MVSGWLTSRGLIFCTTILLMENRAVDARIDANDPTAATFIGATICTEESFHNPSWFKCITCCQAINPYTMKIPSEPNIESRKVFLSHETGDLDNEARQSTCLAQPMYNQVLKEKVLEMKGDLKPECASEAGMLSNFQQKLDCFEYCKAQRPNYSGAAKYCPGLKIF